MPTREYEGSQAASTAVVIDLETLGRDEVGFAVPSSLDAMVRKRSVPAGVVVGFYAGDPDNVYAQW